jgi:hypothetical protein
MSISQLRQVLPPPNSPTEVPPTRPWAQIEDEVGPLPRDYKDFIEEYGTGVIDDFIMVFTPFASNRHLNLVVQAQRSAAALREGAGAEPDALFDVERVRVFGRTDNGDFLAWEVEGPPDEWNVIVIGSRGPFLDRFDGGMTAFLAEALQGNLSSEVLPDDFPSERPSFAPVG